MAIVTGSMYKGFTFGGINSKDYGVYISGDGVFNAPEKDVEMISIPGRSGSFALDQGRWLNIEVAYPAGLFGSDETNFAQAISDLRNALASKKGYQVLEDDYHPGEFRQAIYHSGLEVTPAQLKAGEFNIVFDCKPQRWLTAGQDEITVTSGDEITNPTLFPASPMLMLDGVGDVNIGDYTITVNDVPFGWIVVNDGWQEVISTSRHAEKIYNIDTTNLNTGDEILIGDNTITAGSVDASFIHPDLPFDDATITYGTRDFDFNAHLYRSGSDAEVDISFAKVSFNYGTSATKSATVTLVIKRGSTTLATIQEGAIVAYNGADRISITVQSDSTTTRTFMNGAITMANSTVSSLSGTTYVDLEIAEAYVMTASGPESANDHVIIGAEVPVLVPGANEITYDNTITSLQIIPRWWKI